MFKAGWDFAELQVSFERLTQDRSQLVRAESKAGKSTLLRAKKGT